MICSKSYFSRYFSYSIPINDVADISIIQMISDCLSNLDSLQKDRNPIADDLLEVKSKYKQEITNKAIKVEATKPKPIALSKGNQLRSLLTSS